IVSPLEMTASLAAAARMKVEHNRVLLAMKALADRNRAGGMVFEKLPEKVAQRLTVASNEALSRARDDMDMDPGTRDMLRPMFDGATFRKGKIDIWTQREDTYQGKPVVWVWENGKKTPYLLPEGQFGRDLYASLALQGGQEKGPLVQMMEAFFFIPANITRATVTTSLAGALANPVRDHLAAALVARGRFVPFGSSVKGGAQFLFNAEVRKEYEAMGGIMGGEQASVTGPESTKDVVNILVRRPTLKSMFNRLSMLS